MVSATPKQRKIAIVGSRSVGMFLFSSDLELNLELTITLTSTAKIEAKFGVLERVFEAELFE